MMKKRRMESGDEEEKKGIRWWRRKRMSILWSFKKMAISIISQSQSGELVWFWKHYCVYFLVLYFWVSLGFLIIFLGFFYIVQAQPLHHADCPSFKLVMDGFLLCSVLFVLSLNPLDWLSKSFKSGKTSSVKRHLTGEFEKKYESEYKIYIHFYYIETSVYTICILFKGFCYLL